MKSTAFDNKSIKVDEKSNGNYRRSTRHHEEIAMKSIAFDKQSITFDTKSKWKLLAIDRRSSGNRCEISSIQQEINSIRYEI